MRKQLYDSLKKLSLPRKAFPALAAEKLRLVGFDAPETILDKYPFQPVSYTHLDVYKRQE